MCVRLQISHGFRAYMPLLTNAVVPLREERFAFLRGYPMRHMSFGLAVVAGAAITFAAEDAAASGFMVRENSAESLSTIYAGNGSRADDVATVFNNPAGMSELRGTQIEGGLAVVFPNMHFSGTATAGPTTIPSSNDRSVGQVTGIPHLYGVMDLTDRIKLGLAVTVPFGNTVDYSENWPGRYVNIRTAALSADINPNISFKVSDKLSIGAGVSAQYLRLALSSNIAQFLIFGPGTPDGGFVLKADDWGWGYNFGLLAKLFEDTNIGVTYRSKVSHRLEGSLDFTAATSPFLGQNAPAHADVDVPATTSISITRQITPDLSLSSDFQFTQWHVFRQVAVVAPPNPTSVFLEKYRDSWMLSIGGVYRLNDTWSLRSGVGYDQSPVTDAYRDTGVPDKDRVMIGVGAGYKLSDAISLDLGYAHYFSTGHATMDHSVNATDPNTGVVLHGSYNNALDYIAITLRGQL